MTNSSVDIVELEKLCEQLYNANSPQQIHEANKVLEEFAVSSDCLNKCQILLDRGVSPYSQYISCVVLIKAITRNTVVLSTKEKYDLSKFIL